MTAVSPEYEEAFRKRLVGINGYDIEEIAQKMTCVFPIENTYRLKSVGMTTYVRYQALLQYIGIIDDEETVDFTFADEDGKTFSLNIRPVSNTDFGDFSNENNLIQRPDPSIYYMFSHGNTPYWNEYFPDEKMMYVFHWSCRDIEKQALFYRELLSQIEELDVEKLIIDYRYNQGGFMDFDECDYFAKTLSEIYTGQLYLLIENKTYSCGVIFPSKINYFNENAILVGQPTKGAVNFIAGTYYYELPNSSIEFSCSSALFEGYPGWKGNTLTPDIYIPRTFEDFINNYDRVLETVRGY